jgi:hypothetical protein
MTTPVMTPQVSGVSGEVEQGLMEDSARAALEQNR